MQYDCCGEKILLLLQVHEKQAMFSRDVDGKETMEFLYACIFGVKNKNQHKMLLFTIHLFLFPNSHSKSSTHIGIQEILKMCVVFCSAMHIRK